MNRKNQGFTLVEILTAVIIVAILTAMAVPLYEKTIERSRIAEVRTILSRLQSSKRAAMENMSCNTYSTISTTSCPVPPKIKHLNAAFSQTVNTNGYSFDTKGFRYSLMPSGVFGSGHSAVNGVCAKRLKGDYAGTLFFYYGEDAETEPAFLCRGTHCENYGFPNTNSFSCSGV